VETVLSFIILIADMSRQVPSIRLFFLALSFFSARLQAVKRTIINKQLIVVFIFYVFLNFKYLVSLPFWGGLGWGLYRFC